MYIDVKTKQKKRINNLKKFNWTIWNETDENTETMANIYKRWIEKWSKENIYIYHEF